MNLRLRLMQGQMIVIEDVTTWTITDNGLEVTDKNHNKHWYNKGYIATISEEENKPNLEVIKPNV